MLISPPPPPKIYRHPIFALVIGINSYTRCVSTSVACPSSCYQHPSYMTFPLLHTTADDIRKALQKRLSVLLKGVILCYYSRHCGQHMFTLIPMMHLFPVLLEESFEMADAVFDEIPTPASIPGILICHSSTHGLCDNSGCMPLDRRRRRRRRRRQRTPITHAHHTSLMLDLRPIANRFPA